MRDRDSELKLILRVYIYFITAAVCAGILAAGVFTAKNNTDYISKGVQIPQAEFQFPVDFPFDFGLSV